MYRVTHERVRRLHDGFTDGWVGMNRSAQFFSSASEVHHTGGTSDELCHVCADEVDAKDCIVFFLCDDLGKAEIVVG
jgi:hypothetical protein